MAAPSFRAPLALSLVLGGCGLAALVAPNREVKTVTIILPGTILVGDTVQAQVELKDESGRPPKGDSTVTWQSSDPSAVRVDATGRVTGDVAGRQATISATVGKVTGTKVVTVGDDTRLGYAWADQPTVAGPYQPDPLYRFNSSGGIVEISRSAAGTYAVRFAGLGRTAGQRDNVQVTGYGGPAGTFCKIGGSGWAASGVDLVVEVRCLTPTGTAADSRFTILVSGGRAYYTPSRLGFALVNDFTGCCISLDTSATTRNNSPGTVVLVGHNATGDYSLQFPGLERVAGPLQGPETFQVTAVGAGPEHCYIGAVDPPGAGVNVKCAGPGGPADSRFSIMLFQRGRPPLRFGYALASNASSTVDYEPATSFSRNNSGGLILARRLAIGQYQVVFQGQAKTAGATETILLTPFGADRTCTTTSWGNTGVSDLIVTLACFDGTGAPANTQFNVLMVQ